MGGHSFVRLWERPELGAPRVMRSTSAARWDKTSARRRGRTDVLSAAAEKREDQRKPEAFFAPRKAEQCPSSARSPRDANPFPRPVWVDMELFLIC